MNKGTYSGRCSPDSYKSVLNMGALLGMLLSWLPDPGRLEDAIGWTIRNANLVPGQCGLIAVPLDATDMCSHGIIGIFGRRFTEALSKAGKHVILDVEFVQNPESITWGEFRLRLSA